MTGPRFGWILASEATKLRAARAQVATLAVMALAIPALAVFVGATGSLQPDDTVLGGSLTGAVLGQLAAGVAGVLVMSTEYASGAIRTTFVACPRRNVVLAAKTVSVAVAVAASALAAAGAAYGIGRAMLAGDIYAPGEPMPALLGVAACLAATAVLGAAVATLVRHTAGAILGLVGMILLPSLLGPLFGDLQPWVAGASPAATLQKLTQSSDAAAGVAGSLGAWPSLALFIGATTAVLAAAAAILTRRDA